MYNRLLTNKVPYILEKEIDFDIQENHITDYDYVGSKLLYTKQHQLNPVISIVIPCYNAEFLHIAVESAINQDFELPYEIIIVDNHSETGIEIEEYVLRLNSSIVKYYRNDENIGLFGNWNRCINLAQADYIVYLHADDALVNDTLSKLWKYHLLIDSKSAIIGRYITLDRDNKEIYRYSKTCGPILRSKAFYKISKFGLVFGDLCNGCGALLNKKALIELGGWNPGFFPASDRVLFLLYAERFGLYRINEIVRRETFVISTSSTLYKSFPSVSYYLSRAVILRYFSLKPLWHFFNYHSYIVYKNSRSQWDEKTVNENIPLLSNIINRLYKLPYRICGGKELNIHLCKHHTNNGDKSLK